MSEGDVALYRYGRGYDQARLAAGEMMLHGIADGGLKSEPLVGEAFNERPDLLDALRHRVFLGKPILRLSSSPV